MAKMMLPVLFLGAVVCASAGKATCAVNGAKSVDDAVDAAFYMWAASKRCNKGGVAVKCEIDLTAAIASVGSMINGIVDALDDCDVIDADDEGCGEAAGQLVTAAASLASAGGGIVNDCTNKLQPADEPSDTNPSYPAGAQPSNPYTLNQVTNLGNCVVDAKGSLSSTFDLISSLKGLSKEEDEEHNVLEFLSVLTNLGSNLAASVADCTAYKSHPTWSDGNAGSNSDAGCASTVLGAVSTLHDIADIGVTMSEECAPAKSRLYANFKRTSVANNAVPNIAFAAFLPIAAVLGFMVGSRYSKARSQSQRNIIELESMISE